MKGGNMKVNKYITMSIMIVSLLLLSSVAFAGTHNVVSEKPYLFTDGDTGVSYKYPRGAITMNWKDATRYGFFNAIVRPPAPKPLEYEFVLVAISQSDKEKIKGLWDIYKNGALVCEGCVGVAYNLNQPVGSYFKLYIGDETCYDENWHLSGYVTSRFDF